MIRHSSRYGIRFVLKGECYSTKFKMIQSIMKKYPQIKPENIRIRLIAIIETNGHVTVKKNGYEAIFTPKHYDIQYPNCKKVNVKGRFTVQCIEKVSPSVSESNKHAQISKVPMPTINTKEELSPTIIEKTRQRKMRHKNLKFSGLEVQNFNNEEPPS